MNLGPVLKFEIAQNDSYHRSESQAVFVILGHSNPDKRNVQMEDTHIYVSVIISGRTV